MKGHRWITSVLALLGGHRFIHDLTSSKMLWWKICVPNPNSNMISIGHPYLERSGVETIWNKWCVLNFCWITKTLVLGTALLNWHPGIPKSAAFSGFGGKNFFRISVRPTHQSMTQGALISCFGWSFKNLHWGANPICANKAQNNSSE